MNYKKPISIWIKLIIAVCYIVPFTLDRPNGFLEVLWTLTVVPPLFFAWYYGLKGGIIAVIVASSFEGLWEASEYILRPTEYESANVIIHIGIFISVLISTIGVGIFAERMRSLIKSMEVQKNELEQANRNLEKYANERNRMEQKVLGIIEFLPDATFVVDQEMKVIAWNKAIEEMTGVPKKDMLGKGDFAYSIPFYGEARPQLIDLVFKEYNEIVQKYDYIHKKGNTLYTEVFLPSINRGKGAYVWGTASAIFDDKGEVVGAIESIRDIDDKKQLENKLKESEQRYRSLVELNPQPIVVQEQGIIVYANSAAQGFAAQIGIVDMVGRSVFDFHEQSYHESIAICLDKAVKEGPQLAEQKVIGKNGEILELELASVSIPYQGRAAIMTIFNDVTDRNRAGEVLQRYTEVLKTEMQLAAQVQLSLLPTVLPEIKGYNFAWEFKPSSYISGDMFNIFVLDQNHFGFYMLDVMGHGLAAALQAVSISYILKPSYFKSFEAALKEDLLKPSQALELLNKNFTKNSLSGDFFTIFYGVVNTQSLELIYARAGHPAPFVLRGEGEIAELDEGGLPIGLFNDSVYENYSYNLKPGDKVVLYTDGTIENQDKNEGTREELSEFLIERKHLEIGQLLKGIVEWSMSVEKDVQKDDVALLGIEMI